MAPPSTSSNPFLAHKTADAIPAVLHPLVLLSISDHITRHTLRKQPGPVVGGLLGQQNGRQLTLEHTFDFSVDRNEKGEAQFDAAWFNKRVEQMRLVHKDRQLDLVGWYTVLDRSGPNAQIMQVHRQLLSMYSETTAALLLAFHAEDLAEASVGGKLPLTLYETHYEQDERAAGESDQEQSEDKEMTNAPTLSPAVETTPAKPSSSFISVKLREITYTVDTEESEMISIAFVARGAANASAESHATGRDGAADAPGTASGSSKSRDRAAAVEPGSRKRRLVSETESPVLASSSSTMLPTPSATKLEGGANHPVSNANVSVDSGLTSQEEDLVATLTTRANAVRMLHARLQLLTKYLSSLPEDALARGASATDAGEAAPDAAAVGVSLPILRSIQALVQRLPLLVPPPVAGAFEEEQRRQANDVQLMSLLLEDMMQNISSTREVGDKFSIVENARSTAQRQARAGGVGGVGGVGGGSSSFDTLI
ncbi:hypothetical protein SEPCBS119000_001724 [Sporothrix epigloea]|uniref:COP9 signalosome complex subunit 6 n=1 Tax=Sporothrix epigloea TaxID=1892477 RepID=A0ABP0DDX4_9PEZI